MNTRRTTVFFVCALAAAVIALSGCELPEENSTKQGRADKVKIPAKSDKGSKGTNKGEAKTVEADIKGDGTWLIPADVKPGVYVAPETGACYWERLKNTSGSFNALLANDNVSGQAVVEIKATDKAFTSQDCGGWVALNKIPRAPQKSIPGDGYWLVGTDIAPGQYRAKGAGQCYWARLAGFDGRLNSLIANDNPTGQTIVQILPTDKGFNTQGCGAWQKIG